MKHTFKSSRSDEIYVVDSANYICTCEGYRRNEDCWHVQRAYAADQMELMRRKIAERNKDRVPDFRKLQEEQQKYVYERMNANVYACTLG